MFKYTVSLLVLFVLFVAACAKIDYLGQSYPPTTHVDLYFSEEDIREDYRVMGHVIAQANEGISVERLQKKLEARDIDLREFHLRKVLMESLFTDSIGYRQEKPPPITRKQDGTKQKRSIAAITITSAEEERQIRAIFIKYEQNL